MKNKLPPDEQEKLMQTLRDRFGKNTRLHPAFNWGKVQKRLEMHPEKLLSLYEMEKTGGEPDVVCYNEKTDEYMFYDCSPESPAGRRNVCYDHEALEARKKFKPGDSAMHMAATMGIELLTEEEYRGLQKLGSFDTKTSSWLKTPEKIRKLGGALFADRRFDTVFTYHNGADSYYGSRGFRGSLRI